MAVTLRVRELAEARGLNISTFQRGANIAMSTARRYWYNTSNGNPNGPPLKRLDYEALEVLCKFFGVSPGELIELT
jgi:hypothetical protein